MSTTFDIAEITKNVYVGKTGRIARPFAEDPNVVYLDEADLRRQQGQWDAAKAWADEGAAIGETRRAKLDADREAEATRRQVAARADLEAQDKQPFLSKEGATVNDWERLKGQLIDQELLETPSAVEVEKAKLLATGRYHL